MDSEDLAMRLQDFEPRAKFQASGFAGVLLDGGTVDATEDCWYEFGLCICTTEIIQGRLCEVYRRLIPKCSFTEFWKAYESKQLIALRQKRPLGRAQVI